MPGTCHIEAKIAFRLMRIPYADGNVVEYVQWSTELVERHILAPLRAGTPASQI